MPPIETHPSLEILKELTGRLIQRDADILKKVHQLSVLVEIQKLLIANNDPELFAKIINMLPEIFKESRIYLYKNEGDGEDLRMNKYCEWTAPGISPVELTAEESIYKNLPVFNSYMKEKQLFHFKVALLPSSERLLFERYNVKAVLRIPMYVKTKFWGFLGADNCTSDDLCREEDISIFLNAANSMELYMKNKGTEEDLRYSTSLFSEIWENSSDPIFLLNDKEKILRANQAFYSAFHVDDVHVAGRNIKDVYSLSGTLSINGKKFKEIRGSSTIDEQTFILIILKNIEEDNISGN